MIASTQTNHPLASIGQTDRGDQSLEQAFAQLRNAGLRITQPRVAILTALMKRDQPSSIEQIHGDLAEGSCDLVTVYRCLAAFEEIGLVRRSFFHNGTSLYEISSDGVARYHIVSKKTRDVRTLDAESTEELRKTVEKIEAKLCSLGYTGIGHVVEFFAESAPAARVLNPASNK
jgi:Fur family transcriptional regulator, ferric uptake regulator